MPRKRIWKDDAQKMKAYRLRKKGKSDQEIRIKNDLLKNGGSECFTVSNSRK